MQTLNNFPIQCLTKTILLRPSLQLLTFSNKQDKTILPKILLTNNFFLSMSYIFILPYRYKNKFILVRIQNPPGECCPAILYIRGPLKKKTSKYIIGAFSYNCRKFFKPVVGLKLLYRPANPPARSPSDMFSDG